jgi:hypothetical protein
LSAERTTITMPHDTNSVILELLTSAAKAHGAYEAVVLGGRYDDWPTWYAQHMTAHLADLGFRLARA